MIINTYAAESWDKVYSAFAQINFTSYDYDTVKESLLQYLQIYYSEAFNDMIESSELIAILEMFAYAAELLAYRTDSAAHENFITTAQRKQSVLRLAKLISYSASRNIPARGLVKITSIKTDEVVYDSLGNNLSNITITWNDPNNTNWKEQFFLVMNLVLTSNFGQPSKSQQIADVLMQQYTLNNALASFRNGVFSYAASAATSSVPMEIVSLDIDENGPYERSPDLNAQMSIAYASDGRGDGSDYTGFLMFTKQGTLVLTRYNIQEPIAQRRLVLALQNVNDTDVWINQVDEQGTIVQNWTQVPNLVDQSLAFNNIKSRKKYEIETLENDQIAILFGDGNFSDIPVGNFNLWTRVSANDDVTIPKNKIINQPMAFSYQNAQNQRQSCAITFSLTSALQNNAPSETIEHIRQSAPSTYYAQNRMVNGQDYNTFMLRDSTILKLNTINRTFAGQPKYLDWNDASGMYQNIKLFGDDLTLALDTGIDMTQTYSSSKGLIDSFIEPLLGTNAILNALTHVMMASEDSYGIISYPRRAFVEDNRKIYKDVDGSYVTPYGWSLDATSPIQAGDGSLLEKTVIQGALDGHWYGEPLGTTTINGTLCGFIPDPVLNPSSTGKLYTPNLPRTIDGINVYPPGDTGSGLQTIVRQTFFGLKFNRFLKAFGSGTIELYDLATGSTTGGLGPVPANGLDSFPYKVETLTLEMTSDGNTFTIVSNLRGTLPNYSLIRAATTANGKWSEQADANILPVDFVISVPAGSTPFEAGDTFAIDLENTDLTLTATLNNVPYVEFLGNVLWDNPSALTIRTPANTLITPQYTITFNQDNEVGKTRITFSQPQTGQLLIVKSTNNASWVANVRTFGADQITGDETVGVNTNGWWQLIPQDVVTGNVTYDANGYATGGLGLFQSGANNGPNELQAMKFDTSSQGGSWIFLVSRQDDTASGEVLGWTIYNRDMKIVASSPTTNFWYNQSTQILDPETLKPVYDKIRILRSNLDEYGQPLKQSDIYDCVNFIYDSNGEVVKNSLEILPTEIINIAQSATGRPINILQFESFARNSYEYSIVDISNPNNPVVIGPAPTDGIKIVTGYDLNPYDTGNYDEGTITIPGYGAPFIFRPGDFLSNVVDGIYQMMRKLKVPPPVTFDPVTGIYGPNATTGLDFMWQHFTPVANLIDPSPSNINDAFILTQGYYNNIRDFINNLTTIKPEPPTPLDLRTSYGYLLENKMLSDTVVLHPGKIKLLFGELSDQPLRAKFRVVLAPTATFSAERIKAEIVNTINAYFDIADWDFGDTFYATELMAIIHQALPTQISSVVIVPMYSVNSFGSLFTISSGFDEVLQSCATVNDIEIVASLTPSVLRQIT